MVSGYRATQAYFCTVCGICLVLVGTLIVRLTFLPCDFPPVYSTFGILGYSPKINPPNLSGLLLSPSHCTVGGKTPTGILFIRIHDHFPTTRNYLRQKWKYVEKTCGYRVVYVMGKVTDPWKQGAATKDASRFSDILQPAEVNDFVLQDLPEIIKTFRSWITEKCGPNVVTVIVANNIGNDSFKTVYRNSVVYSLNTTVSSVGKSMDKFEKCLTNASAKTEDPYNEQDLYSVSVYNAPRLATDLAYSLDKGETQSMRYLLRDKQDHIVSNNRFNYTISEPGLCVRHMLQARKPPFIIIFTQSAVKNFELRQKIRETWASRASLLRNNILNIFIVGSTIKQTIQRQLLTESMKHHDIIQGDFVDAYRNLTLKQTTALKFLTEHCGSVNYTFALRTDDDIVLDVDTLVRFMRRLLAKRSAPPTRTFYCFQMMRNDKAPREPSFKPGYKWYITAEEFPGRTYPPYCYGAGYLMTRDMVPALYNMSFYTRSFWVDDVYFTGFVARNLKNVKHVQLPNQSPILDKRNAPAIMLRQKRWLVHTVGSPGVFQSYWTAFQSRWNLTVRKEFETAIRSSNTTMEGIYEIV